jgi:hypothetical protein
MRQVARESGEAVFLYGRNGLRDYDPFTERLYLLQRLLESQDYIGAVCAWEGEEITHDISNFRLAGHPAGVTLADLQARWINLEPDTSEKWLSVEPSLVTKGKIVVARSFRYRNPFVPWRDLFMAYGDRMIFVGLPHEHANFCAEVGHVPYLQTEDLYEVARAIAGSALFAGNQSAPLAVAEGLKHPTLQEVCLESPDCLYRRSNAYFCFDGGLDLNLFGRTLHIEPANLRPRAHREETPPGGWRVQIEGHVASSYSLDCVLAEIRIKLRGKVPDDLLEQVIAQSSIDIPPSPPEAAVKRLQVLLA